MAFEQMLNDARDAMTVKRVFGDPLEKNGVTVIPAARIRGGAGGGTGDEATSGRSGSGGGFGVMASPVGAFVIRGDQVTWQPAVDVNRIVLGGQIFAVVAVLVVGSILRARRRQAAATTT